MHYLHSVVGFCIESAWLPLPNVDAHLDGRSTASMNWASTTDSDCLLATSTARPPPLNAAQL